MKIKKAKKIDEILNEAISEKLNIAPKPQWIKIFLNNFSESEQEDLEILFNGYGDGHDYVKTHLVNHFIFLFIGGFDCIVEKPGKRASWYEKFHYARYIERLETLVDRGIYSFRKKR